MELIKNFINRIKGLHQWRLLILLFSKLDEIARPDLLTGFFPDIIEIIIEVLKGSVSETRPAASSLFCKLFIHLPKFEQRKSSMRLFTDEFSKEGNYQQRLSLLSMCAEALKLFSRPAIRFFILPQILTLPPGVPMPVKMALARMIPDINDGIDPADESSMKKLIILKKNLEENAPQRLKDICLQASNRIQMRGRLKQHQVDLASLYKQNRALEEGYLIGQYDEITLEDFYKRESGQYISKLASGAKAAAPAPKVGPLPWKPGVGTAYNKKDKDEKEEAASSAQIKPSAGFAAIKTGTSAVTSKT